MPERDLLCFRMPVVKSIHDITNRPSQSIEGGNPNCPHGPSDIFGILTYNTSMWLVGATNLSLSLLPSNLANADRSMCVPFVTFPDPPRHRPGGATPESLEPAGPEILQVGKFNTYKKSSRVTLNKTFGGLSQEKWNWNMILWLRK